MRRIVVSKFGGTSVKDADAIKRSAQIALSHHSSIVVLSACSGITDQLIAIGKLACEAKWKQALSQIKEIEQRHLEIAKDLLIADSAEKKIHELVVELETLTKGVSLLKELTPKAFDSILSIGERLSSLIFFEHLQRTCPDNDIHLLDAREIIITDSQHAKAEPQIHLIKQKCNEHISFDEKRIFVTQGFIGSSTEGHTTTLGRGGSDASAALFAEGLNADLLQIWTDVAGVNTTDPNICADARAINEITYLEAAEMAQYGAKVLHPATIAPAMRAGIEIYVGSSLDETKPGTWVRKDTVHKPVIRALAKRARQSLLTVRTPEMLNASGFLAKIFRVFREHSVSVDCVTTSEISIAVTIDDSAVQNDALVRDLKAHGEVFIESGFALISIIGNNIHYTQGVGGLIFGVLDGVHIRMICLGASEHNFCLLVPSEHVDDAIRRLHRAAVIGESNEACIAR